MSILRQTEAWYEARQKATKARRGVSVPSSAPKTSGSPLPANPSPIRKAKATRQIPTEYDEQATLVQWWDAYGPANGYDSRLLFAIPNGAHLAGSAKLRGFQMHRLKASGLRVGVPDLMLAAAASCSPYLGLFLEMKRGNGKPTAEQLAYHALLRSQGYRVQVCQGFESARNAIVAYLS